MALQGTKNIFKNTSALNHCNEAGNVWEEKACFNIRYLKSDAKKRAQMLRYDLHEQKIGGDLKKNRDFIEENGFAWPI